MNGKSRKICVIAQFPPPIHGLSKAADTFYKSLKDVGYLCEKVNITSNKFILLNLIKVICSNADVFYLTISQSIMGNIRDLMLLYIIRLKKKSCYIHLHGGYFRTLLDCDMSRIQRAANYKVISRLSGVIVLSESLKYIFRGLIDDEKIHVVPNCVDDVFFIKETQLKGKQSTISADNIISVLYMSNFIRDKGYGYVLELAMLEKEYHKKTGKRNLKFDFAGAFLSESERESFDYFISKNELYDYVEYHGIVTGERKRKLLFESDVFVLLTVYAKEGQPISILEAMANGAAIVTTKHAAIPDMVIDGYNGLIYEKSDISIEKIYNDILKLDLIKIGNNNVRESSYYTEKRYIENLSKVLELV